MHFRIYEMFIVARCASVPCTSFSADVFFLMKFCMEGEVGGNCRHINEVLILFKKTSCYGKDVFVEVWLYKARVGPLFTL